MLEKTRAILLSSLRYGDSSRILRTYTSTLGIQTYIASSKGKSAVVKPSMLSPLSQLELVFYPGKGNSMQRLKEASFYHLPQQLGSNPIVNCVALFEAELLSYVLKEEEANPPLYRFLDAHIQLLDSSERHSNFPLMFLMDLSRFLGFYPLIPKGDFPFFDLAEGSACEEQPLHAHFVEGEVLQGWRTLVEADDEQRMQLKLKGAIRENILNSLLDFYRLQLDGFSGLRSLEVLKTVLS